MLVLNPAWYDAIAARRSRRRYSAHPIPEEALAGLTSFCEAFQVAPGTRAVLIEDHPGIYSGIGGAYGRVEGAPWTAAFVAPEESETEAGYVGEAFVLEATRLGLGTCWVAGMFRPEALAGLVTLAPGERVVAVTPVGYPQERKQLVEHMMSAAVRSAARRQIEEIAPGLRRGLGPDAPAWPRWAITAVEAARLAPSGANRQPWRFRLEGGALVLSSAENPGWTAPIDFGIAMLHAELGAAREGIHGAWQRLHLPDVACFVPVPDRSHEDSTSHPA